MNSSPPSPPTPPTPPEETGSTRADMDFMALFCKQQNCPVSEYEERAFRMCLYWRARILAPLIRAIRPRFFDRDFTLIRYLATCRSRRNAINELAAFTENISSSGGFARKVLRIRISARKTNVLVNQVFERHAETAASESGWTI